MTIWPIGEAPERVRVVHGVEFVALSPALVQPDYEAVMRDVPMLRAWSGQDWPTPDFTIEENLVDLARHHREQQEGVALTYSLLLDGTVQGCIYVHPWVSSLTTREVTPVPPFPCDERDAVVRGWAHCVSAEQLIEAAFALIRTPPLSFGRLWWQTNVRCPAQLEACERLGLAERHEYVGPTGTWAMCAVPE